MTFNTGQILIGLASGERAFGCYAEPIRRAADWLVKMQDPDRAWRHGLSPFVEPGEKTYETHTAWGLLEAARIEPTRGYGEAALKNIRWAVSNQNDKGWFDKCCFGGSSKPITHGIAYALRGVIEGYRYSHDKHLLPNRL